MDQQRSSYPKQASVLLGSEATPEQLRARLELRRSNAAAPHRNRKPEMKRPGKGNRND
jgi:hypothetical protein